MLDKPVKRVGVLLFKGGEVYLDGWELDSDSYMCRDLAAQACLFVAEQLLTKARLIVASPGGDMSVCADMPLETPHEWLCPETREFRDSLYERPADQQPPALADVAPLTPFGEAVALIRDAFGDAQAGKVFGTENALCDETVARLRAFLKQWDGPSHQQSEGQANG